MRGADRRIQQPGRRSGDRPEGLPTWGRVLVLALTLGLAIYVVLFARESTRPAREASVLKAEALHRDADLGAARLDAELARARAGLIVAAQTLRATPGRPLDALEAARAVAPDTAFAVVGPGGDATAAVGASPAGFRPLVPAPEAGLRASRDRTAVLTTTARAAGLVARTPVADAAGDRTLVVSPTEGLIAGAAGGSLKDKLGIELSALTEDGATAHGAPNAQEAVEAAASPVGDTGLMVVAWRPESTGAAAIISDLWLLIAPLGLGVLVLGLAVIQRWRQSRASRAWAETEHRFRVAVEAARCGVWEWDLNADEVTVSDFMAELLGLPAGGVVTAEAVMERIAPRYRDLVQHALRQAATFGAFEVTFPVPLPTGGARWIDARGQARGARGEEGFSMILGVALDITEARRAKAQAQSAENRLRDGIESVSDAFVLFDKHGRLILWNQAFKDAFGFTASYGARSSSHTCHARRRAMTSPRWKPWSSSTGPSFSSRSRGCRARPARWRRWASCTGCCSWPSASRATAAPWSPPPMSPPSAVRSWSASAPPTPCASPSTNWRPARRSSAFWPASTRSP